MFVGLLVAGVLAAMAALPLLGGALFSMLGLLDRSAPRPGAFLLAWLFVAVTYLAAASAGAIYFWALRPLRQWALGWGVTGAVIAAIGYGAVGLAMWFQPEVLAALGGRKNTPEAAASFLREGVPMLAMVGFAFGIYKYYTQGRAR